MSISKPLHPQHYFTFCLHPSMPSNYGNYGSKTQSIIIPQREARQRIIIIIGLTTSFNITFFHVALSIFFCLYYGSDFPITMFCTYIPGILTLSSIHSYTDVCPVLKTSGHTGAVPQFCLRGVPTVSDFEKPLQCHWIWIVLQTTHVIFAEIKYISFFTLQHLQSISHSTNNGRSWCNWGANYNWGVKMNQMASMYRMCLKLCVSMRVLLLRVTMCACVWHVNTPLGRVCVDNVCVWLCLYRVDRGALVSSDSVSELRSKPPGDLQGPAGPTNSTSHANRSQT